MSLLDPKERTATGLAIQAEATGKPAPAPKTLLEESWRDYIYAEIWTRPGLDRRARYLISIAAAAGSPGLPDRIDDFVRGALVNQEISLSELREAALHVAVYSGWAKADEIDRAVTRVSEDLGLEPVTVPPIRAAPWDPEERIRQGGQSFHHVMTFTGPPPIVPYFEGGILNYVFGEMWCRPGLDQRSRRWLTLVGVSDSDQTIPIRSHFYGALASGNCTAAELHEFVLHYALHAGWPRASAIQGAVMEMAKRYADGLPFA